jgi:hypothetical protein
VEITVPLLGSCPTSVNGPKLRPFIFVNAGVGVGIGVGTNVFVDVAVGNCVFVLVAVGSCVEITGVGHLQQAENKNITTTKINKSFFMASLPPVLRLELDFLYSFYVCLCALDYYTLESQLNDKNGFSQKKEPVDIFTHKRINVYPQALSLYNYKISFFKVQPQLYSTVLTFQ